MKQSSSESATPTSKEKSSMKPKIAATTQKTENDRAFDNVEASGRSCQCWRHNAAATVKMRYGRLVVEAEAAHHSKEYANAAATVSEHAAVRLVAEAAAARHSNDDTNAAAVDTEQAESILVVEATATRNRGEDTDAAAAAPNLDEGASTTAAVTCNPSEDTIQRKETMRSEDSLRKGETLRKETTTN